MSTEIGSFLDWFEERCVRAQKLGFVEMRARCFAHSRHAAGKRKSNLKAVKSDYVERKDRNVRYWAPVKRGDRKIGKAGKMKLGNARQSAAAA